MGNCLNNQEKPLFSVKQREAKNCFQNEQLNLIANIFSIKSSKSQRNFRQNNNEFISEDENDNEKFQLIGENGEVSLNCGKSTI